jgi:hypothetical protein
MVCSYASTCDSLRRVDSGVGAGVDSGIDWRLTRGSSKVSLAEALQLLALFRAQQPAGLEPGLQPDLLELGLELTHPVHLPHDAIGIWHVLLECSLQLELGAIRLGLQREARLLAS